MEFVPASSMTAADIVSASLARRYQVIIVDYLQLVAVSIAADRFNVERPDFSERA